MDPQTGEHYVRLISLGSLYTNDLWFKIPKDQLLQIYRFLHLQKRSLYDRLRGIDQDFYVLVERRPGQGFERVIPTIPTYDPERVSEVRALTLQSIEQQLNTAVRLHYYVHPETMVVTASLEYPDPVEGVTYLALEKAPDDLNTYTFKPMNYGAFFVASEETVIPL
jgi:hypothetical protein